MPRRRSNKARLDRCAAVPDAEEKPNVSETDGHVIVNPGKNRQIQICMPGPARTVVVRHVSGPLVRIYSSESIVSLPVTVLGGSDKNWRAQLSDTTEIVGEFSGDGGSLVVEFPNKNKGDPDPHV